MAESPPAGDDQPAQQTSERDELRTVAFRMREIQRLLAIRVEQENRRLEADGLNPVTKDDASFRTIPDDSSDTEGATRE